MFLSFLMRGTWGRHHFLAATSRLLCSHNSSGGVIKGKIHRVWPNIPNTVRQFKSYAYTVSRSYTRAVTGVLNHGTFCTFLQVRNERKQIIYIALSHVLAHCCSVNCKFHRITADEIVGAITVMIPCSMLHLMHRSYEPQFLTLKERCVSRLLLWLIER